MRTPNHNIVVAALLLASLVSASADWPTSRDTSEAQDALDRGQLYEKLGGHADSAAAWYRSVLRLHEQSRATKDMAQRARTRLAVMGEATVSEIERRPQPEPGHTPSVVEGVVAVTRGLQLGTASTIVEAQQGAVSDPLRKRQRWFDLAVRLQARSEREWLGPPWLISLGQGIEAVRVGLGLRGLLHFVAMEKRRARGRPLTSHERLLAALMAEKEQHDFGGAEQRYRETVRLDTIGGIATRLTERARKGAERTKRWRQPGLPQAAWPRE